MTKFESRPRTGGHRVRSLPRDPGPPAETRTVGRPPRTGPTASSERPSRPERTSPGSIRPVDARVRRGGRAQRRGSLRLRQRLGRAHVRVRHLDGHRLRTPSDSSTTRASNRSRSSSRTWWPADDSRSRSRCRRPGPTGRPIDLDVVAVNHLEDPIGGIVVNVRDITERTQLEHQARDGDGRQAAIIESLADGVLVVDGTAPSSGSTRPSRSCSRPRGSTSSGKRLEDALAHRPRRRRGDRGRHRDTGHGRRPPGDRRAADRAAVGRDGVRPPASGTRPDVDPGQPPTHGRRRRRRRRRGRPRSATSPRVRRVATELRRDQQFLQVLLDTLEEGIVACDAEGRITFFNPSARRLHGLSEESDPIGTIPSDLGLRRPDGSPMDQRGEPVDPGHVRRAAPRRGAAPRIGVGRSPQGQCEQPGRWSTRRGGCSAPWWPCTT